MESAELLKAITRNGGFSKDMISTFPSIEADVYSFSANPNCSCKNRLLNHINSNIDKVRELYKNNSNGLSLPVEKEAELPSMSGQSMSGQVVEIESNPTRYKNLIEYLSKAGKTYKGLTVTTVTNEATGKEVWLVFFY